MKRGQGASLLNINEEASNNGELADEHLLGEKLSSTNLMMQMSGKSSQSKKAHNFLSNMNVTAAMASNNSARDRSSETAGRAPATTPNTKAAKKKQKKGQVHQ